MIVRKNLTHMHPAQQTQPNTSQSIQVNLPSPYGPLIVQADIKTIRHIFLTKISPNKNELGLGMAY